MSYLKPEGLIEVDGGTEAYPVSAKLYFVFGGQWSTLYAPGDKTEEEARAAFVKEVQRALEEYRALAVCQGEQTERPSDSENRGAQ